MSGARDSLDSVIELREQAEHRAGAVVSAASKAVGELEGLATDVQIATSLVAAQLEDAREAFERAKLTPTTVGRMQDLLAEEARLRSELRQKEAHLAAVVADLDGAREGLDEARRALATASAETEAARKLQQARKDDAARRRRQREEEDNDESGVALVTSRR